MPVLQWYAETQVFSAAAAANSFPIVAASVERIFLRIALVAGTTVTQWSTFANTPQISAAAAPGNNVGTPWIDFARATHGTLVQQEFWGYSAAPGRQVVAVTFEVFEYELEREYKDYSAKPRRRNRLDADHLDDRVDYQSSLARRLANAIARLTHGRN